MPNYFISRPGGKPKGPHSIEKIVAACASGELTSDLMACMEGGTTWLPITALPGVKFADSALMPNPHTALAAHAHHQPGAPMSAPAAAPMVGAAPFAMPTVAVAGALPTFPPFAAFSWVICCAGWIWGIIVWFSIASQLNRLSGSNRVQAASVIIPIWWAIHLQAVNATVNEIISTRQLPVQPLVNNTALNILLPYVPFMNIIKTWNAIAACNPR